MTEKTINELLDTFIYLCDQHGILIQATSITDNSFNFKPNIIKWNEGVDLMSKCKNLAVSMGLSCDGNKCYIDDKPKLSLKEDKK